MWHETLLVWLVTWITSSASSLQLDNEAGQVDIPILIPDLSNVDSYALQRIQADKFLTLWHINVLSGPIHISDEPWTLLIPHNTGLPKDPKFIVDTEYTREILLNHVIIGDRIEYQNISNDSNLSFYSLADTEIKFSIDGEKAYANGVQFTGDVLKYKNGIIYVIEKVIEISQPDYLKYVPELKENIFNLLGFAANKPKEESLKEPNPKSKKSESFKQLKTTVSSKEKGPRISRFEKFRNRPQNESLKKVENSGKILNGNPPNDEFAQFDPMGEFISKFDNSTRSSGPKLEEFSEIPYSNETFLESLKSEATLPNSLAREFYYHFMDTNLSKHLLNDKYYTAVIATDSAFYDYYPIDWGFNPFLVKNFTRDVLLNHIIPGDINFHDLENGTQLQTLGGRVLTIHHKEGVNRIEVNGETIQPELEIEVSRGRIYYVDKLLFVNLNRVISLRNQYPFLETGPLISYPWPTSPFLSHLVKRLKDSPKNTIFSEFLLKSSVTHRFPIGDENLQRISYTAFVPTDEALENTFTKEQLQQMKRPSQSFDFISGSSISADEINNFVLNHLFPGYIMEKDFNATGTLRSMAKKNVIYVKSNGIVKVGEATVIGKQQYLYNLGAIYYINKTLTGSEKSNIDNLIPGGTQLPLIHLDQENEKTKEVPFPITSSEIQFPSVSDSDYRFVTRTEVSFSKQINNGEIIPITKEEVERVRTKTV